jgi:hypothetical protein
MRLRAQKKPRSYRRHEPFGHDHDGHLRAGSFAPAGAQVRHARALLFAMDATASREPTWDHACSIQGEMFVAARRWAGSMCGSPSIAASTSSR